MSKDDGAANLTRKDMPNGGEVVSGQLAQRALDAVGARAMTLDKTILVRDDFDADAPEDQALYAHERVHQLGSGGMGPHAGDHDAEETLARDVESMVLHRRRQGESFEPLMAEVESGETMRAAKPAGDSGVMGAYHAMKAEGLSHEEIVTTLARDVVYRLKEAEQMYALRGGRPDEG